MFYQTHEIEKMHSSDTIGFNGLTYTVYNSNFDIVAVYELTFTVNKVINGVHRIK